MAQPGVAREPSMEEILASIRRIIESNEPATSDAGPGQSMPAFEVEDDYEEAGFAAELPSPPPHVPPAANQGYGARQQNDFAPYSERPEITDRAPEKTMSLADVAARVRAAADRNAALGPQGLAAPQYGSAASSQASQAERSLPTPSPRPADVRPLMAAAQVPQAKEVPQAFQPQQPPVPTSKSEPVAPSVPVWENMELRGTVENEASAARSAEVKTGPIAEPLAPKGEAKVDLPQTLVSAQAGAQIARSFGALADVFDGVHRPTMEEVAQDMLRPMLQEWLEDNLPTIVERLVREEIERVARGPRR